MKYVLVFIRGLVGLLTVFVLYYVQLSGYAFGPSIVYFDVGQGDSTLVAQPGGSVLLIDGGPSSSFIHQLHRYIKAGEVIDILIVTHAHEDHILGLIEVVRRHSISTLVLPTACVNTDLFKQLISEVQYDTVIYTNFINVEYIDGKLEIISYGKEVSNCFTSSKEVNNSSVVVQLKYGNLYFLFTGDAESERESILLNEEVLVRNIDVLKAGHHCSNSSSSYGFIEYLKPKVVVCSYGKDNSYGHPGYRVMKLLENLGIKRVDTAEKGDVIINLEEEMYNGSR